jgi:4-hydroxy-3-polyprenylbenzoate decarboxylase
LFLAGVSSGLSENPLLRAADVTLKGRRTLMLVSRESPLNGIHLCKTVLASDAGAIIVPPVIFYYSHPEGAHGITMHIVGEILDIFKYFNAGVSPVGGRVEGQIGGG